MPAHAARSLSPVARSRSPFTSAMLTGVFWSVSGLALGVYFLLNPRAADVAFAFFLVVAAVAVLGGILLFTLACLRRARVFLMVMCAVGAMPLLNLLCVQASIALEPGAASHHLLTVFAGAGLLLHVVAFFQLAASGSCVPRQTHTRRP